MDTVQNAVIPPNVPAYWIAMLVILGMLLTFLGFVFRIVMHEVVKPITEAVTRMENTTAHALQKLDETMERFNNTVISFGIRESMKP